MSDNEGEIEVYIDGSAITNPGTLVGCAGIVKYPSSFNRPNKEIRWPYSGGTSGGMELLALVNALKWLNKNTDSLLEDGICSVSILSDSDYVVNAATNWVFNWSNPWRKDKWKKSDGGTVKHQSLWKDYLRERKKLRLSLNIEWIKGKTTQETKDVDKAAKKASRSIVKMPNFAQTPYKQGKSLLGKKSKLSLFSEVGQQHLIRVASHSIVSRKSGSEYEVRFEVVKETGIEGRFKAFTSQEIGFASIDRGNYYYATFNDDEKLPWITEIKKVEQAELVPLKERVKTLLKTQKDKDALNL